MPRAAFGSIDALPLFTFVPFLGIFQSGFFVSPMCRSEVLLLVSSLGFPEVEFCAAVVLTSPPGLDGVIPSPPAKM